MQLLLACVCCIFYWASLSHNNWWPRIRLGGSYKVVEGLEGSCSRYHVGVMLNIQFPCRQSYIKYETKKYLFNLKNLKYHNSIMIIFFVVSVISNRHCTGFNFLLVVQ